LRVDSALQGATGIPWWGYAGASGHPDPLKIVNIATLTIFKTEKWRNYAKNAKIVKIVKVLVWRSSRS